MVQKKQKLTLVVDPRFSGGTSSAVAREIYALADTCDLKVVAISSKLFKGKHVHPLLEEACAETQTPIVWDPPVVSSDLIALHNPSFLKFDTVLATRFVCDRLFVVCHENLVRPDGPDSFDVAHCLTLIEKATVARRKYLAPISGWNRRCCEVWVNDNQSRWCIAPVDWTNICDFELVPATASPSDRRGRHSRPGIEKFPPAHEMLQMFPETADVVRILGADSLIAEDAPRHWQLLPFGEEAVKSFLESIDFFVYFTHPFLQESFGRVIAEALAAGKVVITSEATGTTFGDGVVCTEPSGVNAAVQTFVADPQAYSKQVARGHASLRKFDAAAFQNRFKELQAATAHRPEIQSRMEMVYDFL